MEMEEQTTLQSHISYFCDRCNYKSKCNFDMENHPCNPTTTPLGNQEELGNLKFLLYLEKFKNKMYINIIKRNTSIDIDDINVNDIDKDMVICNEIKNNIPLFFHDCNDKTRTINKNLQEENKIETIKKHNRYRSIKVVTEGKIESKQEGKQEGKVQISKLREEIDSKINIEEIQVQFTDILNDIEQNKVQTKYNKLLTDLKNKRLKLFPIFTIQDYSQIIQKHIEILEACFKRKDIPDKKIKTLVMKSLSPLDSRLISYPNYHNTSIEVDEMDMLLTSISKLNSNIEDYVPFDNGRFMKHLSNYSCALFSFDNLINHILFNPNGYNNYIYVHMKNDKKNEIFRFYYLEAISKGKRIWTMDCRLEGIVTNITNIILSYMINMFRKLYRDTFQDNHYRSNYNSYSQLTEIDCEQLFKNIFMIGHNKRFRTYLMNKIIEKATYVPTEIDKFNMTSDDGLQKKRYNDEIETDFGEIISQLFDNISFEEIVELYKNKKTSYEQATNL